MRKAFLLVLIFITSFSAQSQLAVSRMIGKNSKNYKIGFGLFGNYEYPLNETGTQNLMIELLDLEYFPGKPYNSNEDKMSSGFLSIKIGYRYIFSEESRTGFYVEPQLGYVRVVHVDDQWAEGKYGDGVAAAFET